MRKIELLAPARNAETGIAAVNHGADAVYIGASKFGARSAASNSIEDIEKLIRYAHIYHAKVYAAVNTILYDHELEEALELIVSLYNAGIDALIIQDMGITEMDIPPVPLHASTQTDNYDIERIKFLDRAGFRRIVLAREMTIGQIKEARDETGCELEFFIHGALCVSLSGRCYMSAAAGGRSANRGECAQPCRKSFTLTDSNGKIISADRYPLSLRDMNQSRNLEELIDAGIGSFKIEGRLKDISYVKNITSYCRKSLDRILEGRSDISKSSSGRVITAFTPEPSRTFNRGFTEYFIHGRTGGISSPHTPKSIGEEIGMVSAAGPGWFRITSTETISNGDGLAFFDSEKNLHGLRVNRVESGNIYPLSMNGIYTGALVYRNHDILFEKVMNSESAKRKIEITMELSSSEKGFILSAIDEDGYSAYAVTETERVISRSGDGSFDVIVRQLGKLGDTVFTADRIEISLDENFFLPVSILNDLRRRVTLRLLEERIAGYSRVSVEFIKTTLQFPYKEIGFTYNVSNRLAENFYRRHGVEKIEKSFETSAIRITGPLMTTKLCLRYEHSLCLKLHEKTGEFREPFYLVDGTLRYRIEFDCSECLMRIWRE